jgi:predicted nucleotidyltransferase
VHHSRATIERFAAVYRQARQARVATEVHRAREVLAKLPALATALRTDFGATRVGYFGSLRSGRLAEDSDVDLYVDRVRPGGYFAAVDRACHALGIAVDLIEFDRASQPLRATIDAEGVPLHG